jgi:hypothetical protein
MSNRPTLRMPAPAHVKHEPSMSAGFRVSCRPSRPIDGTSLPAAASRWSNGKDADASSAKPVPQKALRFILLPKRRMSRNRPTTRRDGYLFF